MSESGFATDGSLLDPDRFREFYDRALPVVYGYFFKRVGGSAVAADLTQETFVSAVRTLRRGAVVEAPMPWIVSIARRHLVDHFRSRTNPSKSGTGQPPGADDRSPWTSAAEARLVEAMSHLSNDHQLALVLRYVDDLTVADVAVAMGRSVRATESVLVRARTALTAAYAEAPGV
jgi:RNA polymerase sigma-70 factor (ECF subfamily)